MSRCLSWWVVFSLFVFCAAYLVHKPRVTWCPSYAFHGISSIAGFGVIDQSIFSLDILTPSSSGSTFYYNFQYLIASYFLYMFHPLLLDLAFFHLRRMSVIHFLFLHYEC
jgi:hypothetical protein